MVRQMLIGLVGISLTGCSTTGAVGSSDPAQAEPQAQRCVAAAVQAYVGQRADQAAGAAILKASGARSLRWGPPGAAWTRDFRHDRVNVQYDAGMIIERVTCG